MICLKSRFKGFQTIGKKMIRATHQRRNASVNGGKLVATAFPITKFPPHNKVAVSNNNDGGIAFNEHPPFKLIKSVQQQLLLYTKEKEYNRNANNTNNRCQKCCE